VSLAEHGRNLARLWPLLDTGAEWSLFDGTVALELGWSEAEIAALAEDVQPISGVGRSAGPLLAYRHRLTCYLPLGSRFALLTLRAFLTPPNTLAGPVLGRGDFFQQVDFALVEAEQRCSLRFRDPSVIHDAWPDTP
jgi:hypothetical protein